MSDHKIGSFLQNIFGFDNYSTEQRNSKNNSNATRQTPPTKDEYIVKRGDTLTEIAVKTGQNLQELIKENSQIKNPNKIYVGQHIKVGGQTQSYTVRRGDTLNEIAKDHKVSVGDILQANPGQIANRNLIYPGQKLHIPVHAKETPTAKMPTTKKTPTAETKTPTTPTDTKTPTTKPQIPVETSPTVEPPLKTEQTGNTNTNYKPINLDDFLDKNKGSNALAAIVIGNAEGNRTPKGGYTKSYKGHTDPGDKKHNLGSFSYNPRGSGQVAKTPEEADKIYLGVLASRRTGYEKAVRSAGLDPNNSLLASTYFDASNQSPRAGEKMLAQLDYIKKNGITPETMKEWRFRGYVNHETGQRWAYQGKDGKTQRAGGGFNTVFKSRNGRMPSEAELQQTIRNDQNRRLNAIVSALDSQGYKSANTSKPPVKNSQEETTKTPPASSSNVNKTKMPDTQAMTDSQKYDLYSNYVEQNGNSKAKSDLANGRRVILGLRQPTNTRVNGGGGAYDDRIVVLWKDGDGKKHVQEVQANTEPSSRYEDTPENRRVRPDSITRRDTNGDGRGDLGMMADGTREYKMTFDERTKRFGQAQSNGKNILTPTEAGNIRRDTNHDGNIDSNDAKNADKDAGGRYGNGTMYFHTGGSNITGSAGCQTMTRDEFNKFWKSLGNQERLQYVLVTVK